MYLRPRDYVFATRINAVMFIVLDDLVEAANTKVKLTDALLLQRLKEQAGIAHGEEILLFLLCPQ